eukprot:ctg_1223.g402
MRADGDGGGGQGVSARIDAGTGRRSPIHRLRETFNGHPTRARPGNRAAGGGTSARRAQLGVGGAAGDRASTAVPAGTGAVGAFLGHPADAG